jgi:hypothetical protein
MDPYEPNKCGIVSLCRLTMPRTVKVNSAFAGPAEHWAYTF